jgi:hypothetical protein
MFEYLKGLFGFKKKSESQTKTKQSSIYLSEDSVYGLNEKFLFDFRNYQSGNTSISTFAISNVSGSISGSEESKPQEIGKIAVKPIDILEELETIPTPWDLANLDDKITILKYKSDLITQYYSKREVDGLIERLENRKKWSEFRDYFESFKNTTDEKIEKIMEKYDLVMKESDLFIPEFPDVAIKTMMEYTEQMEKLCGKKPVFYVIAEPDKFRKAYEKRDPILLVQSPFGFYWQILGAWDKEMLLLSEL